MQQKFMHRGYRNLENRYGGYLRNEVLCIPVCKDISWLRYLIRTRLYSEEWSIMRELIRGIECYDVSTIISWPSPTGVGCGVLTYCAALKTRSLMTWVNNPWTS